MPSFCVEGANIRGGSQKVTSSLPETVSELCFLLRRHLCFNLGDQNCQIVGIHYFNHTTQNWTPLLDRILSNLAPNGERLRVTCETNTTTCSKEATFYEEVVDLMLTSIKDKEVRGFVEDAVYDAKTAAIKDPCGSIADMRATRAFQRLIRLITGHQGILSVNKGRILNPANARHKSLDSCHNIYNITPSRTGDIQENYPASSDRVLRGASAAAYSSRSPTPNSSSLYSNGTSARNATPNQGSYVRDTKPLYEMPKVTPGRPTSAARMRYDVDKIEAHNYTPISMRSEATPTSEKPCATPGVSQLYSGNGPNSSGRKSALRRSSPERLQVTHTFPVMDILVVVDLLALAAPISNITNSATRSLNSESSKSSDMITIYCVYSGTTSQRAKAIQTKRRNPGYDIILFTLRKKFGCDLSLGHIDDTGDCIEILFK